MPITEVALAGFQSYGDRQVVPLDLHLTLLAGRNNVGKSALLRGLWSIGEQQFGARPDFALDIEAQISGDVLARPFANEPSLSDLTESIRSHPVHTVRVELRAAHEARVVGPLEQLWIARMELVELDWIARGANGSLGGWERGGVPKAATGTKEIERAVRDTLGTVRYLAPTRIDPVQKSSRAVARLTSEARNLADVLFHLTNNEPRRMKRITEFVRGAFPEIDVISVRQELDPGNVGVGGEPTVFYEGRDEGVPLRWCGNGVEQLLRLAVDVLGSDDPCVFLIDEPQAYLHPHAERELLRLIDANPQHQYVIASHSHVLLNARPITSSRLITMEAGQTTVVVPDSRQDVLAEIGITAGDLGLAERIIWVEGPSEVAAFEVILNRSASHPMTRGLRVQQMPVAPSQFTGAGRKGTVAYELCRQITEAVRPLPLDMTFLFDRDEKSEAEIDRIREVSGGRAEFLDVRELENLFLDSECVAPFIQGLAVEVARPQPTQEEISAELARLLNDLKNPDLFPARGGLATDPVMRVRGARLLDELTWTFASTRYEKTVHGRVLTKIVLDHKPDLLGPLITLTSRASR